MCNILPHGMRNLGVAAAVLAVWMGTAALRAELPGLPAPAAPSAGTAAAVRPGDERPAEVAQPLPVRGSLFKQGAVASAAASGVAPDGETRTSAVNFIAVAPQRPRRYHKNDIVTVIVREDSDSQTTGQGNAKKSQDFDLALQQFLQMTLSQSGVPTVGTVNNPAKLPEIKFAYSNDSKSDANQSRADSFSARISATVVDVKPNGTMVVEAVKQITVDKEVQTFKLTGVCRAEDIGVDNTLLSTQLANLTISKQTTGMVHDGTKRGWLNQLIDRISPF